MMYRNCSRNLAFSIQPSLEWRALCMSLVLLEQVIQESDFNLQSKSYVYGPPCHSRKSPQWEVLGIFVVSLNAGKIALGVRMNL